jgi:hypothetical protein
MSCVYILSENRIQIGRYRDKACIFEVRDNSEYVRKMKSWTAVEDQFHHEVNLNMLSLLDSWFWDCYFGAPNFDLTAFGFIAKRPSS